MSLLQQILQRPSELPPPMSAAELGLDQGLSVENVEADAERVNDLARTAFETTAAVFKRAERRAFLSDRVQSGQDVATDVSFVGRTALGLTTQGSTALDVTLGNSTEINAWLAKNNYESATDTEEHARKVGYDEKARIAQIARVRAAATVLTGGLYFGIRGLSLASYVKGVDTSSASAPTLLGRVTFVLSSVGSALWGAIYGFLAAVKGLEIWSARDFRRELDEACSEPDKLGAFIEMWSCADPSELEREVKNAKYTPEQLREEALACQAELLKMRMKEAGLPELSEQDRREMALEQVGKYAKATGSNLQNELVFLGNEWKLEKLKAMRHLKVKSLTNAACADKLFGPADEIDSAKLVVEMKSAMNKNFWTNLGYVIACVIGVAATIGAFIATAGIGPLLVTLAFLLVSLMMTGLDGYGLHEAITSETREGRFDKKMLAVSSIISILSFIGSIVLVSVLSLGIVPLIASIAIFAVWLGVNGKVWRALAAKEQAAPVPDVDVDDDQEEETFYMEQADPVPDDDEWVDVADKDDEEDEREEIVSAMAPLFQALYFPAYSEGDVKNLLLRNNI